MTELPKIVRERLKAQASGPVDVHPDADLLTAFSERALTESERRQVIAHLALCAECRDAVALALPPQPAESEPGRPLRERRHLGWAHWFALAASVVVVAGAILQQSGTKQASDLGTDLAVASRPAPASAPAQASVESRPAESATATEQDRHAVATSDAASSPARSESARLVASQEDFGEGKTQARAPAARAGIGTLSAGSGPNSTSANVVGGPAASLERERRDAPSAPPAPEGRANEYAGLEESRRPTDQPKSDALKSKDAEANKLESAAGERKPEQGAFADADSTAGQKEAGAAMANQTVLDEELRKQRATEPATAQTEATVQKKQAPKQPAKISAFAQLTSKLKAPLRWTVSAIGMIQRSFDGGQTWQDLPIREGVRFRAVAAQDGNVWAGGDGGALFHSLDGGETWTPRPLTGDAKRLAKSPAFDILRIDITPAGQVSVTTSQGQTFISTDAGVTWNQQ